MQEQTWWNTNIHKRLDVFKSWVGDENAESKLYITNYLKKKHYTSLIDLGCGNATLYSCFKNNKLDISYTGVDSCDFFIKTNNSLGINTLAGDIRNLTGISDSEYDIGFSRHTLEHQPTFNNELNELIRISKFEACHIFFIKPSDICKINYDSASNLYHNVYSRIEINDFLENHKKVKSWNWADINTNEIALHIQF